MDEDGGTFLRQGFEERAVLRRDGEVELHAATGGGIVHTFDEVLLKGRARAGGVAVELEQALGQTAIVESFGQEQGGYDLFVFAGCHQSGAVLTVKFHECGIECGQEGSVGQVFKERLREGVGRRLAFAVEEGKEVFEHAAGGAGGGNELHHFVIGIGQIAFPCREIEVALRLCGSKNAAVVNGSGGFEFEKRKSVLEVGKLSVELLLGDALLGEEFAVLRCKHVDGD